MRPSYQKPVLLIYPFNLLSHYLRCLELADAIRADFEIFFAYSNRYSYFIERAGFRTFPCEEINPDEVLACARRFDFSWINERDLKRVFLSQVESIEHYRPAVVLGDTAPTLRMATEATQTRFVSVMNGYMTKYYKVVRKIAKVHPAAKFQDRMPTVLFEHIVKAGEQVAFKKVHQPFRRLRKQYGLSEENMYLNELEGDENLICDLPALFPQKDLPDHHHFVGPLFYSGREPESDLLSMLENGRRNILVNMGSSGAFGKVAFLNGPLFRNFNVVVAGDANGVLQGSHVFSKRFLNICGLLNKIDIVICHGGNGSIYQALAFGVPVLCLPTIFEQEWNVQRVAQLQLGACLDETARSTEIRSLIHKWMAKKNTSAFQEVKAEIARWRSKQKQSTFWTQLISNEVAYARSSDSGR